MNGSITAASAESLFAQGKFAEAEVAYRSLISSGRLVDYEVEEWMRRLAEIYVALKKARPASLIYLYLHYFDMARKYLVAPHYPHERACVHAAEKQWAQAAQAFEDAGLPGHAAIAFERSSGLERASELWGQIRKNAKIDSPYVNALVEFNWGLTLLHSGKDRKQALQILANTQILLEVAAGQSEEKAERERAFDCFGVLLKLGKETEQFENLAEGYMNCIRILREDGLKFYALQYYEDFVARAEERGESHAAATLLEEAAEYAEHTGLPYGRYYRFRAGQTWFALAERLKMGPADELLNNALKAALAAFSQVERFAEAAKVVSLMALVASDGAQQIRLVGLADKLARSPQSMTDAPEFPSYLKQQHSYADIWHFDVMEWEWNGEAPRVALAIVGDLRYPDVIRRQALALLLEDDAHRSKVQDSDAKAAETVGLLIRNAALLGRLQSYAAFSPLEKMFGSPVPDVRRAVMQATSQLYFKRAFWLVRRGLLDSAAEVRQAAIAALGQLHFPHAFNSLVRLYREFSDLEVRTAILTSLGHLHSVEAGEFLLACWRQESGTLSELAKLALAKVETHELTPILVAHAALEADPAVRQEIQLIISRLSG